MSILLAGDSTLPNGIRVYEIAGMSNAGNTFEAIVGYRTGIRSDTPGSRGLAAIVTAFLKSSAPVRAMAVAAYGAGGEIEFISEIDRVCLHLKMPNWARPMVEDSIADFLSETPQKNPELVDRAMEEVRSRMPPGVDVPSRVEEQFRIALLGPSGRSDLTGVTRDAVGQFFEENYGTDRAFVAMTVTPAKSLQNVARRDSTAKTNDLSNNTLNAKNRTAAASLRIQSDLDEGNVILGVPVPSVYYRSWYAFLMLDRLIQQVVPAKPATELLPSLEAYFYRMEVPVPSGQTADAVEATFHQNIEQLQFVQASNEQLESARRSAVQYLESDSVRKWYLSLGVSDRRMEGLEWLRSFSAEDMRSTARDLVESNSVVASWSPKVRTLRLEVESLSAIAARGEKAAPQTIPVLAALGKVLIAPFPPHRDETFVEQAPVRLESGVSVVPSSKYAVFVAPDSMTVFDREPGRDLMQTSFGAFRSSRILVLAPPEAVDRVKQQWALFQGNAMDRTEVSINGKIVSAYLPALLVLKMLLDRRLIEAGIWNETQLNIRASEGSTLSIHGSEANRRLVLDWIQEIASRPIPDVDLEWAREAARHQLPGIRPDMQSLTWEWYPDGVIFDIRLIPAAQVQDVARIYLQ